MTSHSDILTKRRMLSLSSTWYGSYEAFQEHWGWNRLTTIAEHHAIALTLMQLLKDTTARQVAVFCTDELSTDFLTIAWQVEEDKESERTKAYAQTLWDTALLESGFEIEAPKEFNGRIYNLLAQAYGLQGDLVLSEEEVKAAAAEEVCPAPEHLDLPKAACMPCEAVDPAVCVGVELSHASTSATLTPQVCPICCHKTGAVSWILIDLKIAACTDLQTLLRGKVCLSISCATCRLRRRQQERSRRRRSLQRMSCEDILSALGLQLARVVPV